MLNSDAVEFGSSGVTEKSFKSDEYRYARFRTDSTAITLAPLSVIYLELRTGQKESSQNRGGLRTRQVWLPKRNVPQKLNKSVQYIIIRRNIMYTEKKCVAMLLAGGQGSRLYALTKNVAKPAVPYGGKYRLIDFPLSRLCTNFRYRLTSVRLYTVSAARTQ